MSFANDIKNLSSFLKEQGFLAVPMNYNNLRSWVKELDSEHLVYRYVYISQNKQYSQDGFLIVSPPRENDDVWERTSLAFGIPLDENFELGSGFYDKYINRLTNLLPSAVCLKEAVINEMHNPSEIATKGINTAKILATRYMRVVQGFRDLQKAPNFAELCQISKETWLKKKKIYWLEEDLGKKYLDPYADDIIKQYPDTYTERLSIILATYSVFR